ncbi:GreA/GreB family elongation factor [Sphingobium algorifonticola]|uniref:Nucleoside-diphosphate kinase n=1 Tax=Sphingobium algorifonticola TaxID=2008318 RepID=A0A437J9Y5_9SPHN|nr:GreA/GreB family elongation factor [Sphingobium algorifonticola]RVT42193.1 nucleoside-diphosphate kinase [Sphingobium algorifonticola]
MSVAFRRESDDEHLEPKFELPIPHGPNLVTPRGLAQIEAKVIEIEAALAHATDGEARKKILRDARYWRTRQATAQLAPMPPQDAVAFGSRVRFRLNGQERTLDIVGDDEADPAAGRIAWSAPLARAMMEAEVGERLDFGGTAEAIEVLEVGIADSMLD